MTNSQLGYIFSLNDRIANLERQKAFLLKKQRIELKEVIENKEKIYEIDLEKYHSERTS
jgi:hypothetical protein